MADVDPESEVVDNIQAAAVDEPEIITPDEWSWRWYAAARSPAAFIMIVCCIPFYQNAASAEAKANNSTRVEYIGGQLYPSSIGPLILGIFAALVALVAPLFGSMADYSSYRRTMLLVTCYLASTFMVAISFCEGAAWRAAPILHGFASGLYNMSLTFSYAYLPEFAHDDKKRVKASGEAAAITFTGTVLACAFVIPILWWSEYPGNYIFNFILGSLFWYVAGGRAVMLATSRDAAHERPKNAAGEHYSLITSGFIDIARLVADARKYPELFKFYIAHAFFSGAYAAGVSVSVSFLVAVTKIDTGIFAVFALVNQIIGVIGALLSIKLMKRKNASIKGILVGTLILGMVVNAVVVFFVVGPDNTSIMVMFLVLPFGGFVSGVQTSCMRAMCSTLCPGGEEAKYMGLLNFFGSLLGWLGPIAYVVINESTGNIHMAVSVIFFMYLITFMIFCCVNPEAGRADVRPTLGKRRKSLAAGDLKLGGDEEAK